MKLLIWSSILHNENIFIENTVGKNMVYSKSNQDIDLKILET
jgi:hypothetical protein